ncbi:SMI1/KNR4 family protein [Actinacidiphila sp. bgisy160]|uniref:SMI1/KNR4 family protein n=1 Tax=Actinacidiphila sp. bgisy160 TaxID=3413796 RepID=UPI003D758EC0
MDFAEFEEHLSTARAKRAALSSPEGGDVFESRRASEAELSDAEVILGTSLPAEYKEFMQRYGGGMFLFLDLLPIAAHEGPDDDLLKVYEREFKYANFVPVAPVGTGDWWGFLSAEGRCSPEVYFRDHEDGRFHLEADSFLEFMARKGLRLGK